MRTISLIFCVSLIAACSSNPETAKQTEENDVAVKYSYVEGEQKGSKAKLAVNGMACEIMCGGLIKKSLKSLDGVATADVSFNPEDKSGMAEVDFDDQRITEKELVAAIEKLNDGQYKVKAVEIVVTETSYEKLEKETGLDKNPEQMMDKQISLPSLSLPNIFDVLNGALFQ